MKKLALISFLFSLKCFAASYQALTLNPDLTVHSNQAGFFAANSNEINFVVSASGITQTNWPYTSITNAPWLTNNDTGAWTNLVGMSLGSGGNAGRLSLWDDVDNKFLSFTGGNTETVYLEGGFFAYQLSGAGSNITSLNATNLIGTLPMSALPSGVLTNGQSTIFTNIGIWSTNGVGIPYGSGDTTILTLGGTVWLRTGDGSGASAVTLFTPKKIGCGPAGIDINGTGDTVVSRLTTSTMKLHATAGVILDGPLTATNGLAIGTNAAIRAGISGQCVMSCVGGTNYWVHDIGGGNWQTNHIP